MAQTENILFRGRRTCICVVKSLPLVEADMKRRGLIRGPLRIFQMGYNAGGVSASAGTHDRGGCTDVNEYSDAQLRVWREWGWTTQHRTTSQGFSMAHGHGFPYGCPHLSAGARYQASEWRAGRNGLVSRGRVTGPHVGVITWQTAYRKKASKLTAATASQGDAIDMAKFVKFYRGKDSGAKALNKYQYLGINDAGDVSFATGPCKVIGGMISVRFDGLKPGQYAWVRVVEDDVDSRGRTNRVKSYGEVIEVQGTPGQTTASMPWAHSLGKAGKGKTRRLRLEWSTNSKTCKVVNSTVAYWKAA